VLLIALALSARLIPGPRTIDDAFITFRYARNILMGTGFVYNPGEHVLGTTTPLYTFLLTIIGSVTGGVNAPFNWISLTINALSDAGTCILLVSLGRKAGFSIAGAAAALAWAVAPFSVTFAIGGLETSLYVFLLTAMCTSFLFCSHRLTALLAVLALLTRPDAALLVAPLVITRLVNVYRGVDRRIQFGELLFFFVPAAIWLIFSTIYFGSPIPNSVLAKSAAYQLEPMEGLVRLIQHYATPFFSQNVMGTFIAVSSGIVIFPILYMLGSRNALKADLQFWPLAIYPWLYFLVFAAANPLIFRWYLTPPLPLYFLFILVGLQALLFKLFRLDPAYTHTQFKLLDIGAPVPFMAAFLIMLLPAATSLSEWRLHSNHASPRPAPQMAYIQLEQLYHQAAARILPDLLPTDVIAAGDVGVIGFDTGARILDTVGLNSPQAISYYPLPEDNYVINYAISDALIIDAQPDWLVILEVYGRETLLKNISFTAQYQLWETLPTDIYGSQGMLIYRHR
jgi:hypothetical protein